MTAREALRWLGRASDYASEMRAAIIGRSHAIQVAEIDAKEAEALAVLEAALTWVPCADRLPPLDKNENDASASVLVCLAGDAAPDVARYCAAGEYREESSWWSRCDARMYYMGDVTHWMPLPESPS